MEVRVDRQGESVTVAPVGSVDGRAVFELEQTLLDVAREGARFLVIDFSLVTSFESAGIRVLIMVMRKLEAAEGTLILCALPADVSSALDVAGLAGQFTMVPTGADALACLEESTEADAGRSALARRVVRLLTLGVSRSVLPAASGKGRAVSHEEVRRVAQLLSGALQRGRQGEEGRDR